MACKPSFPRHEYLPESLPAAEIIVRLIKQAMSQASTHDCTDEQCIKQRVKQCLRYSFPLEEPFEYEPSENEPGNEQHRIPSQGQGPDMENLRIHVPVYHKHFKHIFQI